jgi:L-histidine N-alpha-methyltransferase
MTKRTKTDVQFFAAAGCRPANDGGLAMQASPAFPDNAAASGHDIQSAANGFPWHAHEQPGGDIHTVIAGRFQDEAVLGLCQPDKTIASIWRFDAEGLALSEKLAAQPEYHLARLEDSILRLNRPLLREILCNAKGIVEIGNGRSTSTAFLLGTMDRPSHYVPINISPEVLDQSVAALRHSFTGLESTPLHADHRMPMSFPAHIAAESPRVAFCPRSSIASLMPLESVVCMQRIRQLVGPDGLLIVGQDTTRDPSVLLPAYDDARGVYAAFNLNVLRRLNRELACTFDVLQFRHEARYNHRLQRVETHLVSTTSQWVEVSDRVVHFEAGESIHSGNAYKYTAEEFRAVAASAGWHSLHTWSDRNSRYSVHVLSASAL